MPRPARQRQNLTKSALRRELLIDKLVELFLEEGFADASIDDIARNLHCSKSTLYNVAAGKEQIIVTVVRAFFKRSAARVEIELADVDRAPLDRIRAYLTAIAQQLAPASPAFFADLDANDATRAIYRDNTQYAASRLRELVVQAAPSTSRETATFIGAVAAQVMEGIHRGEIEAATGLDDSAAYRALAELIVAGMSDTRATA